MQKMRRDALKIVATPIKVVAGEDSGHGWLSLAGVAPASVNFNFTHETFFGIFTICYFNAECRKIVQDIFEN